MQNAQGMACSSCQRHCNADKDPAPHNKAADVEVSQVTPLLCCHDATVHARMLVYFLSHNVCTLIIVKQVNLYIFLTKLSVVRDV